MIKPSLILMFYVWLLPYVGSSQVPNDDIENRIELTIGDQPFASNTTGCTVQWHCVDQSLTGKCIQYHNDQWFWFTTQDITTCYINVAGQKCRDLRGVQLVVIEGTPCEPGTYQILNCTSLSTQDDIFVALDSLQPHHTYLLNVDGYLNDHCQFSIQVSTTPRGLPLHLIEYPIQISSKKEGNMITLDWLVTEMQGTRLLSYEIFRLYGDEKKFRFTKRVPHEKNAFGVSKLDYSVTDTVAAYGTYRYKIVGVTNENRRWLLATHTATVHSPLPTLINGYLTLSIPCAAEEIISVRIYNAQNQQLLKSEEIQCTTGDYIWKYNIYSHFHSNTEFFKIVVERPGGKVKEYLYQKAP